jgi:hypothetical protein
MQDLVNALIGVHGFKIDQGQFSLPAGQLATSKEGFCFVELIVLVAYFPHSQFHAIKLDSIYCRVILQSEG